MAGIAVYSAFTVLTAAAFGFPDMAAYRTLSGIGEAMQNAAIFSAVGAYFYTRRSLALGVLNLSYGLGSFLGPYIGAHLLTASGDWRLPFYLYGGVGFLFTVVILLAVNKIFTEAKGESREEVPRARLEQMPRTLLNRNTALVCLTCVAAGLALYSYLGLYPTFLQNQLGFTVNQAGLAAGLFGIGSLAASVPAGYLGDRFGNRTVLMGSLFCAMIIGALMFTVATGPAEQTVLSFLEGAFGSGFVYVNLYSIIQQSVHPSIIGRASGAFVAFFYLPSAGSGYMFAKLVGTPLHWAGAAGIQLIFISFLGIVFMAMVRMPAQAAREPATVGTHTPGRQ